MPLKLHDEIPDVFLQTAAENGDAGSGPAMLVHFWSPRSSCRENHLACINALHETYGGAGLKVVGVFVPDAATAAEAGVRADAQAAAEGSVRADVQAAEADGPADAQAADADIPADTQPGAAAHVGRGFGVRHPVLIDADRAVTEAFRIDGLPACFVFDAGGKLRYFQTGVRSRALLEQTIRRLMGTIRPQTE